MWFSMGYMYAHRPLTNFCYNLSWPSHFCSYSAEITLCLQRKRPHFNEPKALLRSIVICLCAQAFFICGCSLKSIAWSPQVVDRNSLMYLEAAECTGCNSAGCDFREIMSSPLLHIRHLLCSSFHFLWFCSYETHNTSFPSILLFVQSILLLNRRNPCWKKQHLMVRYYFKHGCWFRLVWVGLRWSCAGPKLVMRWLKLVMCCS